MPTNNSSNRINPNTHSHEQPEAQAANQNDSPDKPSADGIPKYLFRLNSSLFARATAKQIFMVDLDIEKKKQKKLKSMPAKSVEDQRVKSDRCISVGNKIFEKNKITSPKKKAFDNSETIAQLNTLGGNLFEGDKVAKMLDFSTAKHPRDTEQEELALGTMKKEVDLESRLSVKSE